MTAQRIDGAALATTREAALAQRVAILAERGIHPCLVAVSVGADPAWGVYQKRQASQAAAVGIRYRSDRLSPDTSQEQLLAHIEALNADGGVHGVIIQSPLPKPLQSEPVQALLSPAKDVEAVGPANLGQVLAGRGALAPCTALSAVQLAEHHLGDVRGLEAVVVGASTIVGKPIAQLLLSRGATPTVCHIDTQDLASHTRRADLLIVAVGRAGLIRADMVKPGATVIDVGINRITGPDGKGRTVGDVHEDVWQVAGALTPVPGGVGSLTTTILLEATAEAAERLASFRPALEGYALVQALGEQGIGISPEVADRLAALLSRHLVSVPEGGGLRSPLQRRLDQGVVVLDGAMGTELIARGLDPTRLEWANREQPEQVRAVHQAYFDAGAHILTTNTFRAHRCRLGAEAPALVQAGVRLARQVARGRALVFASVGPLGPVLGAEINEQSAAEAYAETALAAADAGADGFILETFSSTAEAALAVRALHGVSKLPVMATRSFAADDAPDIAEWVQQMELVGVAALGINCVSALRAVLPAVQRVCALSNVPVIVRPNAGFPTRNAQGKLAYHLTDTYFVRMAKAYVDLGVRLVGGCCGTTPAHIHALVQAAPSWKLGSRPAVPPAPLRPLPRVVQPHAFVRALQERRFPVLATLPARLGAQQAAEVLTTLAQQGVLAGGLLAAFSLGLDPTQQAARLRHLRDISGVDTVLELAAGTLSLMQAQQVLLHAQLLGLQLILLDDGVFASGHGGADTAALLRLIRCLNGGRDLAGNRLPEAAAFVVGVRLRADAVHQVASWAELGAAFVCLQPIYQASVFRSAMAALGTHLPVLAEILLLPDAQTADAIDNEIPALSVPQRLKERLAQDPGEDVRGVLRFLAHWRERLSGLVLFVPDERLEPALAVLRSVEPARS